MSTIVTIAAGDLISNSRADLNTNFVNLNADKEEVSNKDTDTSLSANSDTKYPSQKAVKTYIDTSGGANASETVRGIVEEATDAEVTSGASTGGTGAKLFITPAKLKAATSPTVQVITATGTWTKPSGIKFAIVEVVGGGGGGGGQDTDNTGAGGGGGGGYSKKIIAAATLGATETVTIGAAGAAGAGTDGTGGTGGTTSFGTHAQATGGAGGVALSHGGAGGIGSLGTINVKGQGGGAAGSAVGTPGGAGGSSVLGGGAQGQKQGDVGIDGGVYGGGGGGASPSSGTQRAGGAGAAGVIIVTEYYV